MPLTAGTQLGPYEIIAPIGAGGMGEVYRARDTRLGRFVALKILPVEVNEDPSRARRFQTEAKAAAALSHPNIVAVYDVGEAGGVPYIVSELVEGTTLASLIGRRPLSLPALLDLAIPIAEALASAHARGVIHRDLKPANILLSGTGQPKIADFGLAKVFEATDEGFSSRLSTDAHTAHGTILGTTQYLSPEQARGDAVDVRSDQFSFGVILYEMATGKRPFDRETSVQTVAAILDQDPAWPDIPERLKPIVRRCLQKDPGKRYAATEDLVHDLRALRERPLSRRNQFVFGVLAAAAIAAGAFWMWRSFLAPQESTSLAVLPFRDLGRDAALTHFGLGVADGIISRLSSVQSVTVRPTSAIARYENQDVDAVEAGRRLRVQNVLEGTFQKIPGAMRVTAQLTDVSRGAMVWSKQVELPDGELFKIQDMTSVRIVEALRLRITPEEKRRLTGAVSVSDEATREYLTVRAAAVDVNRASNAARLALLHRLDKILEQEPDFARALGTRAYIASLLNFFQPSSRWHDLAVADAERALELSPGLVEALVARANVLYSSTGGWQTFQALHEARRAVQQGPGDEIARLCLARLYRHIGRMDQLRAELKAAETINPEAAEISRLHASALFEEGKCREATDAFRTARTTEGDVFPNWQYEAQARLRCGEVEPVLTELEQRRAAASPNAPERAFTAALLAIARQRAGKPGAQDLENEALSVDQRIGHFHHTLMALAELRALRGDRAGTIEYLRRTAEAGMPCMVCFEKDPLLADVRTSPEFQALIAELRDRKD
jgi:TolB-like protein/tetratricopeptide (TPR) repeat protein